MSSTTSAGAAIKVDNDEAAHPARRDRAAIRDRGVDRSRESDHIRDPAQAMNEWAPV